VRGLGVELRGYVDTDLDEDQPGLVELSEAMKPFGMVVASPAEHDYNPFKSDDEYTRMMVGRVNEAEEEADRLRAELDKK